MVIQSLVVSFSFSCSRILAIINYTERLLIGIGGQGGAVFFESTENATLKNIWKTFPEKQIKAFNGEDSNKARILGRRGSDIKVSHKLLI